MKVIVYNYLKQNSALWCSMLSKIEKKQEKWRMNICENNTNQFSAKMISKAQSRRSSQVLSICSLSASWLNCYIFSCPLKILLFGANNHQNQVFQLFAPTTPYQAFLKEKLLLFLYLAKTWFWAFFAPKVEIITFLISLYTSSQQQVWRQKKCFEESLRR